MTLKLALMYEKGIFVKILQKYIANQEFLSLNLSNSHF
jgi:hypothetical protein